MTLHPAGLVTIAVIAAMGVVGNLFTIGAICIYKRLRVRGHAFIINLSIADLIVVSYIMPVGLVTSQFNMNPFGETMCQINAFLVMTSCGVSTQTLMLISIERYFHICKMKYYRKIFTPKLIGLYIALSWIYTSVWTSQGWTGWISYVYAKRAYICVFNGPSSISYSVCLALFGMFLPLVVLGLCYYKIFHTVIRSRRFMSTHRKQGSTTGPSSMSRPEVERQTAREYRLIVMLFTIIVVFIICWLPACLVLTLAGAWRTMPTVSMGQSNTPIGVL